VSRHFDFTAAYRAAKAEHVGEPVTFTLGDEQLEEDGERVTRPVVIRCAEPFDVVAVADFIEEPDTLASTMRFLRAVVDEEDRERFETALHALKPRLDNEGLAQLVRGLLSASAGRPTKPSGDSAPVSSPDGTSSNGAASARASRRRSRRASAGSGASPTP
jgi:hypothetical protein